MSRSEGRTPAVLALLLNAATWGLSWWPFRHLQQQGLHPLWTTAFIFLGAALVVGAWRPRALVELVRHRSLWWIVLASGLTNAGFNWGVTIGDVTRVVLLFYLMPMWATFLAWWLLGERPGAGVWWRVALSMAGAALLIWPSAPAGSEHSAPLEWSLADGLGLVGGMAFALNNVMLRRESQVSEATRALAMFVGGALLPALGAWGLSAWGGGRVAGLPAVQGHWLGLVLALAVTFLISNLALQYGASRLPAQLTAVVMPSEVLFATASAVAWGGTPWSMALAWGGLLILLATALAARSRSSG